jgi:hypothetical protein
LQLVFGENEFFVTVATKDLLLGGTVRLAVKSYLLLLASNYFCIVKRH